MISPKDKYIIVNYHYVHDPQKQSAVGEVFPCVLKDFNKQIKYLSENYKIVSIPELYEAVRAQQEGLPAEALALPKPPAKRRSAKAGKFCAITFDDGLKDNYQNVLPVMKKYGVTGTFFIITSSFEGKMSIAHKVHAIRSQLKVDDLIGLYRDFMPLNYPEFFKKYPIPTDYFLDKKEKYDDMITSNLKTTLTRLPAKVTDSFLLSVFKNLDWSEKKRTSKLFMSKEEVKTLEKEGMTIGSHGFSHDSLLAADNNKNEKDLFSSKETLEDFLNKKIITFSYPHGQYGPKHPALLKKLSFEYGVTTQRRALKPNEDPMLLPRYDVNDLRDIIK